jgi:hypothetical protein
MSMPSPPDGEAPQNWEARDTQRQGRISRYPEHVDRWAIIVGISEYQHEDWNLKYARAERDILAEAERAFDAYLGGGAPLGHRKEVNSFLRARREQGQTR